MNTIPQPPSIIFEDNHLIAVNKRSGDIVQEDKTGDAPMTTAVKAYIKEKYAKPGEVFLGVAHRIDRPVSGVVLFARTSKALERLNNMLRDREVKKTYWAVVKNKPPQDSGTLIHFLSRNSETNKAKAFAEEKPGTKRAELHYKLIGTLDRYFVLEVNPVTGRHHQIRVQLASIGCPIRGDIKYGFARTNPDGSIHLHARKLELMHPVQKTPVSIIADPPNESLWNEVRKIIVNG